MRIREFVRHFKIYFIVNTIFIALGIFSNVAILGMSQFIGELSELKSIGLFGKFSLYVAFAFMGSFLLSLLLSSLDILIVKRLIKTRSSPIALICGFLVQSMMIVFVIGLVTVMYELFIYWMFKKIFSIFNPSDILLILVHLNLAIALSKFLIEIDHKLGPGNIWKVLSGQFYSPKEEQRIFMFIDMRNATTIAENLGHLKFSKLLQDCFYDFGIVDKYRANIYQYVGDEVVISWSPKDGIKNTNFLKAFFEFNSLIECKSAYYQEQYGIVPYFKAGANMGPVIMTEVGDIKREITYHGDTVNTASRIQDKCNQLDAQMLIPESLYELVKDKDCYELDDVGSINLKGKEKEVHLYKVSMV